jgi:hypothetical protein
MVCEMTERPDSPTSPTTNELLMRIVQLEGMAVLVKKQQADITSLKAKLADLGTAFKAEVDNTSDHFKSVYRYIADIHDQLWPLVRKVFPGSAATQKQIKHIIRNGGRSWDDKKSS